ncbi:MAG: hypothetical protein LBS24_07295 [Clostridiales Family XIII bacterium]|jgi:hypothetical protein|nr:hypothetical protein [Clostridiales Family XIII bacterium]
MINLAEKYASQIGKKFSHGSYIKGNTSNKYDFSGVKTIRIITPITVPEGNYQRSGMQRYGTPVEMQDEMQELVMSQDRSATLTIDKGNLKDQLNLKGAGEMIGLQLKEQTVPNADRYAFLRYVQNAGKITAMAKPDVKNIVNAIVAAEAFFDENEVPDEGRILYITTELYSLIQLSDQYMSLERLGQKAVSRGEVGELGTFRIIKVPLKRLPENVHFLATYKGSLLFPFKIQDAKYHSDPPGISGDLLELRHYYDAFVIGTKAAGVYAAVATGSQQAAPTVTYTAGSTDTIVIASAGASEIKYTLDGTDPRYSTSAAVYSAAISTATWPVGDKVTVRTAAYSATKYTSDVTEQVVTVA